MKGGNDNVMHEVLEKIGDYRVVPIIAGLEDLSVLLSICDTLAEGGLPLIEITLRTAVGMEGLRLAARERPGMLVGAGTVLTIEQAECAVEAGAHFLVSPGLDPELVRFSNAAGIPITPGACTPTEVQTAMGLGVEAAKFFPAPTMGGTETLRFMAGPFPSVKFVPTGGLGPANLEQYFALPNVLACGGSWVFGRGNINRPNHDEIGERVRATVAMAKRHRAIFEEGNS
jgi:2-dehydro-3-deoxyphosphogluconate aldolase/(4S)-4-hydroxy-2-oxoglutarate aldolase